MCQLLIRDPDPPNRVLKRAQYEAFEFSLLDGDVRVRNESHQDPTNHEYRVTIVGGIPTACECPADEAYDHPCKHRIAVAIRPRILDIATKMRLVADGGTTANNEQSDSHLDTPDREECDCDGLTDDFPCWDCVRTGRRDLPN